MIRFTTEMRDRCGIVHLSGAIERDVSVDQLIDHLAAIAADVPTLLDVSDLEFGDGPGTSGFLDRLACVRAPHDLFLVDSAMTRRRRLRALGNGMAVLPDVAAVSRTRPDLALDTVRSH